MNATVLFFYKAPKMKMSFIWYLISSLIDLQIPWCMWDALECVYEHVPRESDVEVTKPEELSAMAKHGVLKPERISIK